MSDGPYSASSCQVILEEIGPLLRLYNTSRQSLERLQVLVDEHLQDNSQGNDFRSYCCFGMPGKAVPLQQFNDLCILPASNYCVRLAHQESSGCIGPSKLELSEQNNFLHDFAVTAAKNIVLILEQLNHPRMDEIKELVPTEGIPLTWSLQIIGCIRNKNRLSPQDVPPLDVLRTRIRCSLDMAFVAVSDARAAGKRLKFFCQETGALWQSTNDDSFDAEAIYMKAGSEFKNLLQNLLNDTGQTFDELAGVKPTKRYPDVEKAVLEGFQSAQLKGMESLDLRLDDGEIGGTVIAMHNAGFLSAQWIAAYLVDTDQNLFMADERALKKNNKERFLRIFASNHDFENPTWMQFGKKSGVYLYLSQRASAAEQSWLTIVSYIVNLLIDDINKRLDSETGARFRLEQVLYDVGVVSLADPSLGSYARHQDGFPGLIDPLVRGFSRYNLIVPTMGIQNHFAETSTISWYKKGDDKGKASGFVKHDFFIWHWQLPGVNHFFEHEVSGMSSSSPIYFVVSIKFTHSLPSFSPRSLPHLQVSLTPDLC
jgi:hypothetical protein